MRNFDIIIVGLGAMGSAALYQLSKTGLKVLGIDRFRPPHNQGSSHGDTRLTRQAIGEGTVYTPLVLRSNQIWKELEDITGWNLLNQCGGLIYGNPDSDEKAHQTADFFNSTVAAAFQYNIEHEVLTNEDMSSRYPQFQFRDTDRGYFEPGAGYLNLDNCIKAQLELAIENGAKVIFNEPVTEISEQGTSISVNAANMNFNCGRLIISNGAWIKDFLPPRLSVLLKVYPQTLCWAEPDFIRKTPVFIRLPANEERLVYGFPQLTAGAGMKIASEQFEKRIIPGELHKYDNSEEAQRIFDSASKTFKLKRIIRAESCMYTVAPDGNFIIDHSPVNDNIILASPCSGHGFKHSAAVGELLADMVQGIKNSPKEFHLNRFS